MPEYLLYLLAGLLFLLALLAWFRRRRPAPPASCQLEQQAEDWRRSLRAGLEQLRSRGFAVYHDLQTGKFCIDHLLIGRNGVFVLESGSLASRVRDGEAGNRPAVRYENGVLHFGRERESAPERAWAHANWISGRLSRRANVPVRARPLVVLDGWKVTGKTEPALHFVQSAELADYLSGTRLQLFSDRELQRIVEQLEEASF